jgi:hypothetical protein
LFRKKALAAATVVKFCLWSVPLTFTSSVMLAMWPCVGAEDGVHVRRRRFGSGLRLRLSVTKAGAEIFPWPIAAQASEVLVPATGAEACDFTAVARVPLRLVLAVASAVPLTPCPMATADTIPPCAPWPIAIAVAVPPPPPVAVAFDVTEVVPITSRVTGSIAPRR